MKAIVVNPEAVGNHKRILQFYLRDSSDLRSYGPIEIDAGAIFVSGELGKLAAASELKLLRDTIAADKIKASIRMKDGIAGTKIIVLAGRGDAFENFAEKHQALRFERVGVTDRIRNSLDWPLPEVEISGGLESCVIKQRELNNELRKIDDDFLMPLKLAGVRHKAAYQWLIGGRLNVSARSAINEALRQTGEEFCRNKAAAFDKFDEESAGLEARLKVIDAESSLLRDDENMRVLLRAPRKKELIDFEAKPDEAGLEQRLKKLKQNVSGFDIEVKRWWTEKPIVYLVAIVSSKGNFVAGEFGIGKKYVETFNGEKAEYFCFKNNEAALIKWVGDKLYELDPMAVITQNGLNYDYPELARRGVLFRIGPDNALPRKLRAMQGVMKRKSPAGEPLTRRGHPAAFDFDLLPWARSNLRFALTDARLETIVSVAHNFLGAKVGYTKSHTYEQQKIDVELAQTNPEVAYGLARYALEDALAAVETGKRLMQIPLNIAMATGCPIPMAFNGQNRKIAVYFESKKYYQRHGKPRNDSRYLEARPEEYESEAENKERLAKIKEARENLNQTLLKKGVQQGLAEEIINSASLASASRLLKNQELDEAFVKKFTNHLKRYSGLFRIKKRDDEGLRSLMYAEELKPENAKGIFRNVVVGYLPLYNSIPALAEGCKQKILECSANAKSQLEKIIYSRFLDEFVAEPLVRILQKNNRWLWTKYNTSRYEELEKQIRGWLAGAREAFGGNRLINCSKGLVFVEQNGSLEEIAGKGFVPFGNADIVSLGKGEVIYKIGNEILAAGVKIPSLKRWQECDAPKDYNPNVKIKAMRKFVENIFVDRALALRGLSGAARALATGSIPKIDYLQRISCSELPENLGGREQQKLRAVIAKQFGLKPGEDAIFGISFDSANGIPVYVRYDPEKKNFDREFIPFTKHYQDAIFGTASRLWDIASAVCLNKADANYANKKKALENVMYGKGTEEEIKLLASAQL